MSKSKISNQEVRQRYSDEYKQEALNLADRVGVAKAATQLGLAGSQLYNWRAKARGKMSQGDRERQVLTENARLKRKLAEREEEVAILKKAAVYFAKESR